jgi:hypothetical protein
MQGGTKLPNQKSLVVLVFEELERLTPPSWASWSGIFIKIRIAYGCRF